MASLNGKRILVVEDEFLVAGFIEDALGELGAIVVGPVYRIEEGLVLAREEPLDGAVLDINLNDERSDPIADALKARGIPFIFATGYGRSEKGKGVPVVDKPYTEEKLADALDRVLTPSTG
ncbi:MAG: response regulator [Alphaproteobacteria bacterium]